MLTRTCQAVHQPNLNAAVAIPTTQNGIRAIGDRGNSLLKMTFKALRNVSLSGSVPSWTSSLKRYATVRGAIPVSLGNGSLKDWGSRMRSEAEREYGDFVEARAASLVRFAYLLCGDWHRAEDTVQSALTKLYLAWPRLARTGTVDAYVRRIVLRVLVDDGRLARYRRERLRDAVPEPVALPDSTNTVADRVTVLDALRQLPAGQRAVLVLRFWEDQSVEQAAKLLGCSTGTIKSQSARGLRTLRELLGDQISVPTGRIGS
jgi:RNA polymerase sigma-70 factor (sigma-E family)